jgi:hypothetical protein
MRKISVKVARVADRLSEFADKTNQKCLAPLFVLFYLALLLYPHGEQDTDLIKEQ